MGLKILWHSAAPWNYTGYGVQTFHWVNILKMLGHDVKVVANSQMFFSPVVVWSGIEVIPCGKHAWGIDNVLEATFNWKPDAVISLMDVWVLPEDFGATIRSNGSKWYPYAPIDHQPASTAVMNRLVLSEMPLGMSKFAMSEIKKFGLMNAMYWPHGVSTNAYKPIPDKDVVGAGANFSVGMVSANADLFDRKAFTQNMLGYKLFHDKHPDSTLYIHTDPCEGDSNNQDLIERSKMIGIEFNCPKAWSFNVGYTPTQMAEVYNSFDVLLHCSRGEGFGLPILEAQACGIPVITTDFSAMSELGHNGWLVPVAYKEPTILHSWMAVPDVQAIADSLCEAYDMWKIGGSDWEQKKYAAYTFAQDYAFPAITEKYVLPILEKMNENTLA